MIRRCCEALNAWRKKRYWAKQHMDFVRQMVNTDYRWLASNPVASELTERYRKALADDWYRLDHEDVGRFRERIYQELFNQFRKCIWKDQLLDKLKLNDVRGVLRRYQAPQGISKHDALVEIMQIVGAEE